MNMLKQLRIAKKLTQDELGKLAGVGRSNICLLEKNGIKTVRVAKKYAKILGCNYLILFQD